MNKHDIERAIEDVLGLQELLVAFGYTTRYGDTALALLREELARPDKPKTTQWFPYSTPPKREGRYECTCGKFHSYPGFAWTQEYAASSRKNKWRGLVREAK